MELSRLLRVLRQRWPIAVFVAIVGFLSGFGFTQLSNENLEPVFEASIPLRFDPQEGQTIEDLSDQVQEERDLAILAAEPLLAQYPGSLIFADTAGARVVFTARGSSSEEARERAESLVEAYFETDPVIGGDVDQRLQELQQQAGEIERQIAELQPELSSEERELVAAHDVLDRQVQAVEDELVLLSVGELGATEEVREQNNARRDQLRETLGELEAERASLPERPSEEPPIEDRFRLAGLARSLDILQLEYERLYLRTVGVATSGRLEPAGLNDLTPNPANAFVNGIVGLFFGAAVSLFGLVGMARLRKEVWLAEDLPIPVLGELPDRKVTTVPGPTWYDVTTGGRRKEGVQALRTAIEGALDQDRGALAVVAESLESSSYHVLALDVAASLASAGRRVLVVDADYTTEGEMTELKVGEPSLARVLHLPSSASEHLTQQVDSMLDECVHIRRDLAVMPGGVAPDSPADALAGSQFGTLISRAKAKFDLVVVIAGTTRSATSRVVVQRAGNALIAVSPGKTTVPSVINYTRDLRNLQARAIGAVLVYSERLSREILEIPSMPFRARTARIRQPDDLSASPVTRLNYYPSPVASGSQQQNSRSLRDLILDIADKERESGSDQQGVSESPGDMLGTAVMEAMDNSDPAVTYWSIADYVVTRIEDIVTASTGQTNLSPELIDVVLGQGFIPLTPVKGHHTAGELLASELVWELGSDQGHELAGRFSETLCSNGETKCESLDEWLIQEFFKRHIERMDGEPEVWHLTSESGTLQLLVHGRRLTRDRLTQVNTDLVRRKIDETERLIAKANEEANISSISSLKGRLRELHAFEVSIGVLQAGSSEEAKLLYPWLPLDRQPVGWAPIWTEGILFNIAPLQKLGLLARPVLSNEDLSSVELTG